jgi:hypothetical protein
MLLPCLLSRETFERCAPLKQKNKPSRRKKNSAGHEEFNIEGHRESQSPNEGKCPNMTVECQPQQASSPGKRKEETNEVDASVPVETIIHR